jgi:hypothetical protein
LGAGTEGRERGAVLQPFARRWRCRAAPRGGTLVAQPLEDFAMSTVAPPLEMLLPAGQLLRWHERQPAQLRVAAGRVWVTQTLDHDDHFLDAGATLPLAPHAQVLIGAEPGGARIVIERAAAPRRQDAGRLPRRVGRLVGLVAR